MNATLDLSSPPVRDAIARSAEMRLIGLLLERPRAEARAQADAIAREVADGLKRVCDRLPELFEL